MEIRKGSLRSFDSTAYTGDRFRWRVAWPRGWRACRCPAAFLRRS